MTTKLNLTEIGNGFPTTGELIGYWDDGEPRVFEISAGGSIETHGCGRGNTCLVEAVEIDVDDCDEIDMDADDLGLRPVRIEIVED